MVVKVYISGMSGNKEVSSLVDSRPALPKFIHTNLTGPVTQ